MSKRDAAKRLLAHYIQLSLSPKSSETAEIESIVDLIVDAAVEQVEEDYALDLGNGRQRRMIEKQLGKPPSVTGMTGFGKSSTVSDRLPPVIKMIRPEDVKIVGEDRFTTHQRLWGMGLHPVQSKVRYIGVFFEEITKRNIIEKCPPRHERVFAGHVTIKYDPGVDDIASFQKRLGEIVSIEAYRELWDDRGQTIAVGMKGFNQAPGERCFHVTISCDKYTEPNYSNYLTERLDGEKCAFSLQGRIGFMMSDGTIDFGGPPKTFTLQTDEIETFLKRVDDALADDDDDDDKPMFEVHADFKDPYDAGCPAPEESDLATLLRDALGEFPNERGKARGYVNMRYPELRGEAYDKKVAEVEQRVRWARGMHIKKIKKS